MTLSTIRHAGQNGSDLYAVLSLSVLQSLNARQISALKSIGIGSLTELLHYMPIHRARVIAAMARGEIAHELSLDGYVVSNYAGRPAAQLISAPPDAIRGLETPAAAVLADNFGVHTVGDVAAFEPFLEAQRFLTHGDQVFNEPESAPHELVPRASGAVASSCSYSSFVREDWLALEGMRVALNPVRQHYIDPLIAMLFMTDGHVDLGLGYVARHRQRWVNMGTYLGEIQHSLGLAPGDLIESVEPFFDGV